jgi:hypothetical protein
MKRFYGQYCISPLRKPCRAGVCIDGTNERTICAVQPKCENAISKHSARDFACVMGASSRGSQIRLTISPILAQSFDTHPSPSISRYNLATRSATTNHDPWHLRSLCSNGLHPQACLHSTTSRASHISTSGPRDHSYSTQHDPSPSSQRPLPWAHDSHKNLGTGAIIHPPPVRL